MAERKTIALNRFGRNETGPLGGLETTRSQNLVAPSFGFGGIVIEQDLKTLSL